MSEEKNAFPGIAVVQGYPSEATFKAMDKFMDEWTNKAARGECGWVCPDCCSSWPDGMPDACDHGHESCTKLIQRDKRNAGVLPKEPKP
jgi:hypothetical protein